ncbi:MAG TPA: cupin domain-containing protein [Dehalococcoidia bacterium]|jgi:hypothetical protein|nr:cupin domain-containing protein [Dehalococcoidia bacterium]
MHASKDTLPAETMGDSYEGRFADWGEYTGYFESIKGGTDFSPLFVGLPDDSCQCPHWGYLFKGKLRFIYKDHDEVISAGEAYYAPPGHKTECLEDAETVEFSPMAEFQHTMEVAAKNLEAQAH